MGIARPGNNDFLVAGIHGFGTTARKVLHTEEPPQRANPILAFAQALIATGEAGSSKQR